MTTSLRTSESDHSPEMPEPTPEQKQIIAQATDILLRAYQKGELSFRLCNSVVQKLRRHGIHCGNEIWQVVRYSEEHFLPLDLLQSPHSRAQIVMPGLYLPGNGQEPVCIRNPYVIAVEENFTQTLR